MTVYDSKSYLKKAFKKRNEEGLAMQETKGMRPAQNKIVLSEEVTKKAFEDFNRKIDRLGAVNKPVTFSGFMKFIYKSNPFYLISACLFLYAMTIFFNTGNIWIENSVPMSLIAAYSALLTGTAILIVRAGKVWDDAKSLLFITLFMFIFLSVGMDYIILENINSAQLMMGCWFVFCVLLSESMRWGLKIKMPRLPLFTYYALLALFFFYPQILGLLLIEYKKNTAPVIRGIMIFEIIASLIFLCLIPAVRKGAEYFKNNGTPWKWPYFPWSFFGALAFAVCCRVYLMSISFIPGKGVGPFTRLETGFDLYMIIPILMAFAVLFTEHAKASKNFRAQKIVLGIPLLFYMTLLSGVLSRSRLYYDSLTALTGQDASPYPVIAVASILFCAYAWIRKIKYADIVFIVSLTIPFMLDLKTGYMTSIGVPYSLPLFIFTIFFLVKAAFHKTSVWAFLSVLFFMLSACVQFRNTWFDSHLYAIPLHISYAAFFAIGLFYKDAFARWLREGLALPLPIVFFIVLYLGGKLTAGIPAFIIWTYIAALIIFPVIAYYLSKSWKYIIADSINIALLVIYFISYIYMTVSKWNIEGVGFIFWCGVAFIAALIISLFKGGVIQKYTGIGKFIEKIKFPTKRTSKKTDLSFSNVIIVLFIFSFIIFVVFPVVLNYNSGYAREKARRISCASNLKQIGLALKQYSMDYNDQFPPYDGAKGLEILRKNDYLTDYKIYTCPSSANSKPAKDNEPLKEENVDYVFRGGLNETLPADTPIAWDKNENHTKYGNILYIDGHVTGHTGPNWNQGQGQDLGTK
jgi:prepilin-type processing-associated H-X9-DG protein